jgi:G:T/U-mismatch repair DNA glycosylase
MNTTQPPVERHPWPPYIPDGARFLFLGTFPPKPERWSMPFFYPNRINDFWRVMGLIFMNDRDALWDSALRSFDLDAIKAFLDREHIALWDTAMAVRRLKDNASDKFLEIVEPINLAALLDDNPTISHVITTGEKATGVIAAQAGIEVPPIGSPVECRVGTHDITLWRMPSTSRAYPLALEKKADAYRLVFDTKV